MTAEQPWREKAGGLELRVRLTPRSSRDQVDGVGEASDGSRHLAARVRAVPEKGAANKALEVLIAGWLGVPRSQVEVAAGTTSRIKSVLVSGEPQGLSALAARKLAASD